MSADGASVYVSRFITPPLPGEGTASVQPRHVEPAAQVVVVDAGAMTIVRTIVLRHSDRPDFENQGRGIPNYLGAAVISPDGTQAWVPSKQDNIERGALRDGTELNFQNTVRAISSRIDLAAGSEDAAARIDHDNASVASAVAFDPRGVYLFVALETSREVAVVDAHGRGELFRFDVGRAPQGLALSPDGKTLFVNNFMDRTVGVYDLRRCSSAGESSVAAARDAGCGRDREARGEGADRQAALLRRARPAPRARPLHELRDVPQRRRPRRPRLGSDRHRRRPAQHDQRCAVAPARTGFLHWSDNFDEVQDFEGQIRTLAGGTGLMSDAAFATGTRSQPLGDRKAGVSADLDALAAYVASLNRFDDSPYRAVSDGAEQLPRRRAAPCSPTATAPAATAARAFTVQRRGTPANVGTIKPSSGQRLGGALTGIDPPTLRDVWATAPYLHDGSAATLESAVRAHSDVVIGDAELASLVAYLREIGSEEATAPVRARSTTGTGLTGRYFNNTTLSGTPALTRIEAVDFDWGSAAPGSGVTADNFSVRWTGSSKRTSTGAYRSRRSPTTACGCGSTASW